MIGSFERHVKSKWKQSHMLSTNELLANGEYGWGYLLGAEQISATLH